LGRRIDERLGKIKGKEGSMGIDMNMMGYVADLVLGLPSSTAITGMILYS
jgi:hypothetical protein